MGCWDVGLHARGVYPTQDTSRIGTERREKEADTKIIVKWKKGKWLRRSKVPNKALTTTEDLTKMIFQRDKSPPTVDQITN